MSLLRNVICILEDKSLYCREIDMLTPAENSERSTEKHMQSPLEAQYASCVEALPRDNRML